VIAGGVKVTFHSWESPNGTNESRGQVGSHSWLFCLGSWGAPAGAENWMGRNQGTEWGVHPQPGMGRPSTTLHWDLIVYLWGRARCRVRAPCALASAMWALCTSMQALRTRSLQGAQASHTFTGWVYGLNMCIHMHLKEETAKSPWYLKYPWKSLPRVKPYLDAKDPLHLWEHT